MRLLGAALVLLAACKPPKPKAPKKVAEPTEPAVGKACTSAKPFSQGDCEDGLVCAPFPGGYCMAFAPCDGESKRVETAKIGEICGRPCTEDGDCRTGYTCHPGWKACVPPKLSSPKLAKCEAAQLTRKGFFGALALTDKDSPGLYQAGPVAALDNKNNLVVAYLAGAALGKSSKVATLRVGVGEEKDKIDSPPKVVDSDRTTQSAPWLTRTPKGDVALVFLDQDGVRPPETKVRIAVSTSRDGGPFGLPVAAHDPADCGDNPSCLDKPMIAFGKDPKSNKDTLYSFYFSDPDVALKLTRSLDFGKTFATPSVAIGNGAYASVDVSPKGILHLVYQDGEGDPFGDVKNGIRYLRSDDGGKTFAPAVKVNADDEAVPFYFSSPQVVVDEKRKLVYAAYPAGKSDGVWNIMLATSKDNGATWSRVKVNDDAACANHAAPSMALDLASGRVHLTWMDHRAGSAIMAYAACETGGAKCGENEAVSDQPFASYGLVRKSPKWTGDYRSMVVDPVKKVLHAVWAQTVNDDGKMVSRVFHAKRKL